MSRRATSTTVPAGEPLAESGAQPSSRTGSSALRRLVGSGRSADDAHDLALLLGVRVVEAGPILILFLVVAVAAALAPGFLTTGNLTNLGFQASIVACLALGQLVVIVTRGIDLSVGSTLALASVTGSLVADGALSGGLPVVLTIVLTGAAVGFVNGFIFIKGRIPHPFVVTLATFTAVRGLALLLVDGQTNIGMPQLVLDLGAGKIAGFPIPVLLVLVLALVLFVVMQRTQWGRWIYAIGGNPDAAARAGIPVGRVLISVYVLCGLAAGFAGLVVAGRTDAGSPTAGNLAELDSIAAVIIGGAAFAGGRGTVVNALVGALAIGVIRNAMNLMSIEPFWQLVVLGAVILVAVEFDVLRGHLEERVRTLRGKVA